MKLIGRIASAVVLTSLMILPAHAGNLKVTVEGVRSDDGALMIGFYDSALNFEDAIDTSARVGLLNDKGRLVGVTMRAKTGPQGIAIMKLPPGRYGVIVFHDENDNGLLDVNIFGLPVEGYGFSNNVMGFLSAPSFDKASITVGNDDVDTSISLTYQLAAASPSRHRK
ncbi:MAG: hypothetical protein CVT73_03735 [Alphaproteobacteria bacterium HGW-Alphaproteobacteria-12]|nr:MAG: hypothetical protein CVT73_03735 [Alphaproteobacteria bacterium HGW-Alphaproteobacteria-12]